MERRAAVVGLVAGLILWAATAITFFVEIGLDHDMAEGIGLLGFILGLFLVWEGGFSLVRSRTSFRRDNLDYPLSIEARSSAPWLSTYGPHASLTRRLRGASRWRRQ